MLVLQGILGTTDSGKSALVHRYLTGSYMQEESPEGKRCRGFLMLGLIFQNGRVSTNTGTSGAF